MRLPLALALLFALPASAEVIETAVEYDLPGGGTARGVAVYDDDADGDRPGVLVVPEWWGLTDYPKMRARELAEQGYVALVADMYGDGFTTDDPAEAGEMSGKARRTGLAELAAPAVEELKKLDGVDPDRLAAIGFCFGGSTVVDLAASDAGGDLSAVVSFHGGLGPDAAPAAPYEGPAMLILHGGSDPMVQPEPFSQFVQKCIEAAVPISVVNFPGAVHAFTNPDATAKAEANPQLQGAIAYDEQAAKMSMEIMGEFLEITLGYDPDDGEDDRGADAGEAGPRGFAYMLGSVGVNGTFLIDARQTTLREFLIGATIDGGVPLRVTIDRGDDRVHDLRHVDLRDNDDPAATLPIRDGDVVIVDLDE